MRRTHTLVVAVILLALPLCHPAVAFGSLFFSGGVAWALVGPCSSPLTRSTSSSTVAQSMITAQRQPQHTFEARMRESHTIVCVLAYVCASLCVCGVVPVFVASPCASFYLLPVLLVCVCVGCGARVCRALAMLPLCCPLGLPRLYCCVALRAWPSRCVFLVRVMHDRGDHTPFL